MFELWCNGNTADFGSVVLGSNPGSSTQKARSFFKDLAFVFANRIGLLVPDFSVIDSRDDPQQNDCTDDSRCQTAKRPDGSQSDERENPSAQNTADDTDDQIDEQP